jgi:hypothetical protein
VIVGQSVDKATAQSTARREYGKKRGQRAKLTGLASDGMRQFKADDSKFSALVRGHENYEWVWEISGHS